MIILLVEVVDCSSRDHFQLNQLEVNIKLQVQFKIQQVQSLEVQFLVDLMVLEDPRHNAFQESKYNQVITNSILIHLTMREKL